MVAATKATTTIDTEVPAGGIAADEAVHRSVYQRTRDALMKQPKQRIRLTERTFCSINGVNFDLPAKEWLDVPEQVADILAEAGRI